MHVLALNGSPRSDGMSKSKIMLNALVEGMREAGAEVDVVDLREKKVRTCRGCMCCWTATPGVCAIKDDMTAELFPKWLKADLAVYAFPLYHFTVNADMKAFIERTLPVLQPFFISVGKETLHPLRHRHPRVAFLSVAGFPEYSVFDQLSSWVRFLYGRFGILAAEIYRPMAEGLTIPSLKRKSAEVLDATRRAGSELVEQGTVSEETLSRITQDMHDDPRLFLQAGDLMWKACIREGVTVREFFERGLVPRPEDPGEFMTLMQAAFKPEAAQGMSAVIQFDFSGRHEDSCCFAIDNGTIRAAKGAVESPGLTIRSDFDLWMDILCNRADGQQMFLEHKYTALGDLSVLIRMKELFAGES